MEVLTNAIWKTRYLNDNPESFVENAIDKNYII